MKRRPAGQRTIPIKVKNPTATNLNLSRLGLVLAAWTFYGLFFASQNYFQATYLGREVDWKGTLSVWLTCAYSWAALTPLVLYVTRRISFGRPRWLWTALAHIPLSVIFSLTVLAMYTGIRFLIFRDAVDFRKLVVGELHISVIVYFAMVAIIYAADRLSNRTDPKLEEAQETTASLEPALPETQDGSHSDTLPSFADRFSVRQNGRIVLVKTSELDVITSDGNYLKLHVNGHSYLLRETMKAMEQKLDPAEFIRIRRSAMVRIEQIKELHPLFNGEFEIILKNGKKLSSSRRFRKNLDGLLKD